MRANGPCTSPVRATSLRGLLINNIYNGIFIDGVDARDNVIEGNWIGFQHQRLRRLGQHRHGVEHGLEVQSPWARPTLAGRNVIGNMKKAVDSYGPGDRRQHHPEQRAVHTTGRRWDGASAISAVDHDFGPKNGLVGGLGPNERNVIGPTHLPGN